MRRRRWFILFLSLFVGCILPAFAKGHYLIGSIQIVKHPDLDNSFLGFKKALEDNGFIEGENTTFIVNNNPSGKIEGVKEAIQEYIDKNVDLIFAITSPCAMTAVKSTSAIPVVFAAVREPVKLGIVKSLEHPGANATGVMLVYPMYNLIRLAKDLIPGIKNITFIEDKNKALKAEMRQSLVSAAENMGVSLDTVYISGKDEIDSTVGALRGKTDCIIVNNNMEVMHAMDDLIKTSLRSKIPLITTNEPSVVKGALATSAVDYFKEGQKAGKMAVSILKGASPSVIQVEEPSSYRLVINLKTARTLGINIPGRFQSIADRLIK